MSLTNSSVFGFVWDKFLSLSGHDALEEMVIVMPELEVMVNAEGLVVHIALAEREATVQSGQGNVPDEEEASTSYERDSEPLGRDAHVEGLAELFEED